MLGDDANVEELLISVWEHTWI